MINNILVSIIIPSYNSNDYLFKCLNSFGIIKDRDDVEFIIIDDCSNIHQYKYITNIEVRRIKFIRNKKNEGLSISRNIGIQNSKGKYIVFVDSDDCVIESEFNKILSFISSDDSKPDLYRVGIQKKDVIAKPNFFRFIDLNKYLLKTFIVDKFTTITSVTHIYKREIIKKYAFPNKKIYSEDLYHFFIITSKIKKIITLPLCYYIHNQNNPTSITKVKQYQMSTSQHEAYLYASLYVKNFVLKFIVSVFYIFVYRKKMKGEKVKKISLYFLKYIPKIFLLYLGTIWNIY